MPRRFAQPVIIEDQYLEFSNAGAAPRLAGAGKARLYYDRTSNTLKTSVNGGAYTGSGGSPMVLTSGAAADIPLTINLHAAQTGEGLLIQKSNGDDLLSYLAEPAATPAPNQRLQFATNIAGKGPMLVEQGSITFAATPNPLFCWGYNSRYDGTPVQAAENYLCWRVEGDYNDGANRLMETYTEYKSADTLTMRRGFFQAWNRSTNALVSSVLLGNPLTIRRDTDEVDAMTIAPNNVVVSAVTGQDTVLSVNAATGRTANIRWGLNGTAGYVTMASATNSHVWVVNGNTGITHFSSVIGAAGTGLSVGVSDNSAVGVFAVGASNVGAKGVVIRRKASQTGNLLEIQHEDAATRLTYWDENGRLYQNVPNSAAADADLSNNHLSPYLDAGETNLIFKVRTSAGTIKTATIAIA